MQWDKVKNVLIGILLAVNLFLLGNLGFRLWQNYSRASGLDADLRALVSGCGSTLADSFRLPEDVFLPELNLDRSRADVASIRTAVQYLKNGESIGIFPEGTRHRESFGMGQIHDGAAWLALKSGAPIVPVFIDSRGMFHKIRFYVGDKLPLTLDEGEALNAKSRDAAAQKLAEAMARLEQMAENAQKR